MRPATYVTYALKDGVEILAISAQLAGMELIVIVALKDIMELLAIAANLIFIITVVPVAPALFSETTV